MKRNPFGLFLILCILLSTSLKGQSIIWQLPPTDYDEIMPFGAHLYKVTKSGKIGLIDAEGNQVMPAEYDEITRFYERKALVLKREGGTPIVGGVLSEDGTFVAFQKKYYLQRGHAFFSDEMLAVADERGNLGYINDHGIEVIGFDGSLHEVKPFTEGHAAVYFKIRDRKGNMTDRKFGLINKRGEVVRFPFGRKLIYGGTNLCKGKAVIWDDGGTFYAFDISTGECVSTEQAFSKKTFTEKDPVDFLACFSCVSGRNSTINYTPDYVGRNGISAVLGSNGLYGFSYKGRTILPPQFSTATAFLDDIAIVTQNNKKGLLRWVEDTSNFEILVEKPLLTYYSGDNVSCEFLLTTPDVWKGKLLNVVTTDSATGEKLDGNYNDGRYSFNFKPQDSSKSVLVAVSSEGLDLWNGQANYTFKRKEYNLQISINIEGYIANQNDQIPVVATIYNPNPEKVTTTVHMTGSSTFVPNHSEVTIPAGSSVKVHSYFHIVKDVSDQSVHVSTSKGGRASKTGLKFESCL